MIDLSDALLALAALTVLMLGLVAAYARATDWLDRRRRYRRIWRQLKVQIADENARRQAHLRALLGRDFQPRDKERS